LNPSSTLPAGACDTHFHVFEHPQAYPIRHKAQLYVPPLVTFEQLLAKHKELGIERGVIVHSHNYGHDYSMLLDFLRVAPQGAYRGIVMIDDSVSDAELETLHAAGVRGARFHFQDRFGSTLGIEEFQRSVARIAELGWITKIFAPGTDFQALESELRKIKSTVLIDHMGRFDLRLGTAQPAFGVVLNLLRQEHWWMQLSDGDVRDEGPTEPWSEAIPFGRAYYDAAPDRCIWGSDYPHISYYRRGQAVPDDTALLDLLGRYLPDEAAWRAVLTDNPARLFGFH
jgi:2-pyrone-4,6-dicarboxylate lactonase